MSKNRFAVVALLAALGTFPLQIAEAKVDANGTKGEAKAIPRGNATPARSDSVKWRQSPILFLPSQVAEGERSFIEGDTIVAFPLRWALATRLNQDVTLTQGGEAIALEAQSLLPKVSIGNPARPGHREAYCTRSRVAEHREGTGFGGAMFGSLLNDLRDKQVCLEDTDRDGTLDHGIVLGDGDGIIELGDIPPIPFAELAAEPIGATDNFARLWLLRVGRDQIDIEFDIVQHGEQRNFSTMQSGRFKAEKINVFRFADGTTRFNLLGIRFDVWEADQKANSASLELTATAKPTEFVVIPDNVETRIVW